MSIVSETYRQGIVQYNDSTFVSRVFTNFHLPDFDIIKPLISQKEWFFAAR